MLNLCDTKIFRKYLFYLSNSTSSGCDIDEFNLPVTQTVACLFFHAVVRLWDCIGNTNTSTMLVSVLANQLNASYNSVPW